MTKRELINAVYEQLEGSMTKESAADAVSAVFDTLASTLKSEGRFSYPGFGKFRVTGARVEAVASGGSRPSRTPPLFSEMARIAARELRRIAEADDMPDDLKTTWSELTTRLRRPIESAEQANGP